MSLDSRTPVSIVSLSLDSSEVGGIPLSAGCPTPTPPTSTRGKSQIQIRQHQDDCVTYLGGQSLLHCVTSAGQNGKVGAILEPPFQHQGVLLPQKSIQEDDPKYTNISTKSIRIIMCHLCHFGPQQGRRRARPSLSAGCPTPPPPM